MADNAAPAPEAPTTPAPTEANTTAAPAAPEVDPFDALLKTKPLTFKSNGKDVAISDRATLTRRLQQQEGVEKARAEARESLSKAEELRREFDSAKSDPIAALTKVFGSEAEAEEAVGKALWARIQAKESLEALTPQQRRERAEREAERGELDGLKREKLEREQAATKEREQAQYVQIRDVLSSAILDSLKAIGASPKHAKDLMPFVARRIGAAVDDGMTIEAAMADAIKGGQEAMDDMLGTLLDGGVSAVERLGDRGKAFIAALRKHDIESWRASGKPAAPTPAAAPTQATDHPRGRIGLIDDMLREEQNKRR